MCSNLACLCLGRVSIFPFYSSVDFALLLTGWCSFTFLELLGEARRQRLGLQRFSCLLRLGVYVFIAWDVVVTCAPLVQRRDDVCFLPPAFFSRAAVCNTYAAI